jgi:hypothetical protein
MPSAGGAGNGGGSPLVLPLFAVTLFVSAFLLFLVQPMIGKMILPPLGGTPQVWNTCMVFFQTALLAGYAYTHTVSTGLPLRRQLLVHGILLFLPMLVLLPFGPFNVSFFEPPPGANPVPYTLGYLALIVGLPFFVVSTSAPLLQKWFAHTGHESARDPYFLYGASNVGSMLALFAYPFVVEPFLTLHGQAWTWVIGYLLLLGLVLFCASLVWKAPPLKLAADEIDVPPPEYPAPPPLELTGTAVKSGPPPGVMRPAGRKKKGLRLQPAQAQKQAPVQAARTPVVPREDVMTPWRRLRWILLAAAPSSLMLGAISYISTDLSPIPMFWVLPLALYLLTFILVFARYPVPWTGLPHTAMLGIHPFLVFLLCFIMIGAIAVSPIWRSTTITLLAFFFTALVCHGELARDRPSTKHLTEFYLWMSFGGMLGGVFNGLLAPVVFPGVWEYPLALVAACLMRPLQKSEGWSDNLLFSPDMLQRFQDIGNKLGKMPAMSFVLILVLALATAGGIIYLIAASAELSHTWLVILLGMCLVAFITICSLRFSPTNTLSFFLDGLYPLMIFCVVSYVLSHAQGSWGWRIGWQVGGDPNENSLLRAMKVIGLNDLARIQKELSPSYVHFVYYFLIYGIPFLIAVFYSGRSLRFGLTVGAVLLVHYLQTSREESTLYAGRSYFGVLRVYEDLQRLRQEEVTQLSQLEGKEVSPIAPYRYLMHGTTHHGLNYQKPEALRRLATTYYHRMGPTGIVMEKLNWFPGPQNTYWADARLPASFAALGAATIGAGNLPMAQLVCAWSEPPYATVGLGTGTMASYGRPFQHVTFYEIDHTIRSFHLPPYATNGPFFNYLQDAVLKRGVNLEVVMGDARQSMHVNHPGLLYVKNKKEVAIREEQLNPHREKYYRVIELDAFSSDAIPVHLITKEAIELYFTLLVEQGVLCVHTSNRHVDLVQPVVDIASKLGYAYRVGKDNGEGRGERDGSGYRGHFGQEYVMLARKDEYLPKGDANTPLNENWIRSLALSGLSEDDIQTARPVVSKESNKQYMVWYTPTPAGKPMWTDDYSNLVGVLRESFALTVFLFLFAGIGVFVVLVLLISKNLEQP